MFLHLYSPAYKRCQQQEGALPVLIATMTTNDDFLRDCVMAILRNITLHPENKVINRMYVCTLLVYEECVRPLKIGCSLLTLKMWDDDYTYVLCLENAWCFFYLEDMPAIKSRQYGICNKTSTYVVITGLSYRRVSSSSSTTSAHTPMYNIFFLIAQVKFVREGGMPPLVSLIRSLEPRVQEQAAVILRNLSVNVQSKVLEFMHACIKMPSYLLHECKSNNCNTLQVVRPSMYRTSKEALKCTHACLLMYACFYMYRTSVEACGYL
jgi:hypothetical protein